MPRTKGSKNRPKHTTNSVLKTDFATQITEKQETIVSLNTEIASITANMDTLKADLKEKKAKEDAKAAEEAKKAEAESVLKKLLAGGMSADEILAKLK